MSIVDTREDILFKLKYATCFGKRMARFLVRCQWGVRIVTLLTATYAMSNLNESLDSRLLSVLGVILATVTIIEIVIDPGKLAESCRLRVVDVSRISAKFDAMSDSDLRSEWANLTTADVPEIKSLRMPVFNEVALQIGRSDVIQQTTRFQRFMYFMA